MENNTGIPEGSNTADNASSIFGTSSDAIIEGLHKGQFVESNQKAGDGNHGDKEQIVNQQDQQRIVNPGVKDINDDEALMPKSESGSALNETGDDVFQETESEADEDITEEKNDTENKPPVQKS